MTIYCCFSYKTPDKSQPSRLPPPMKPKLTADNEDGNEARESEAVEEAMETNDDEGMTAERLRSTYHSSDMALAFGRLVRLNSVV